MDTTDLKQVAPSGAKWVHALWVAGGLFGPVSASAQSVAADCAAEAVACVASCAVNRAFGAIIGGARSAGKDECRATCEGQRQQCQQSASSTAPGPGATPHGEPARPAAPSSALPPGRPDPALGGTAPTNAAAGHVHRARQITTSADIESVTPIEFDGSTMIGYGWLTSGKPPQTQVAYAEGDVEATRMFMLMHIAGRPAVLDHLQMALAVARAFLPPQAWDEYIDCGVASQTCTAVLQMREKSDRRLMRSGVRARVHAGQDWKGSNEFERPRSHKAFVQRYGPLLRAQAPTLPQDITLVVQVQADMYSAAESLLPFVAPTSDRTKYSPFGAPLALPLAQGYCAATSAAWPAGVPASPAQAEALVAALGSSRRAYLAIKATVTHVDATAIGVRGSPSWDTGGCKSSAQVRSISLYADEALTTRLHAFGAPRAAPAAPARLSEASTDGSELPRSPT